MWFTLSSPLLYNTSIHTTLAFTQPSARKCLLTIPIRSVYSSVMKRIKPINEATTFIYHSGTEVQLDNLHVHCQKHTQRNNTWRGCMGTNTLATIDLYYWVGVGYPYQTSIIMSIMHCFVFSPPTGHISLAPLGLEWGVKSLVQDSKTTIGLGVGAW